MNTIASQMETRPVASATRSAVRAESMANEAEASAVSWPAVIAGAFVAAALSLSILALGAGLGLSAVSPWAGDGASASGVGVASVVWLIVTQIIAAAMGGYVAGRLRTKWAAVHNDEVFFRDTAHGFLVWAVGLVITASLLASAAASMTGGVAKAGMAALGAAAMSGGAAIATTGKAGSEEQSLKPYFVDSLFRSERPLADENGAATRAEAGRLLFRGRNEVSAGDRSYLAQLVATRTGISQLEAEKRVSDLIQQIKATEVEARQAVDEARKAAMKMSLWLFVGLLAGAFFASFAATFGGRQRDSLAPLSVNA